MVKTSASLGNSILLGVLLVFLVLGTLTEGKYGAKKKTNYFLRALNTSYLWHICLKYSRLLFWDESRKQVFERQNREPGA